MRITIDAVPLLVRSAGVKNFLFHWVFHLRRLLGEECISLFPYLSRLPGLDHEGSIASPFGTLARQGLLYTLNHVPNHAWDRIGPRADIFHTAKLIHPPRRPLLTATIHDMTCWLLPEFHQPANVVAEYHFAERIWKRAAGLITVSESSRRDAIRILGLNPELVHVVYPGVPEAFFNAAPDPAIASRYGLSRPYALCIGTVEPRKNLDRLLDAWQGLPASLHEQFDLVAAGPEGWQSAQTMTRLRGGTSGVRYLGYVPEADLPALTATAAVSVYPSLYEGFGFPVAQAMAAGVAVITSNLSSLPEIAGGAAVLIDPRSTTELSGALARLLTSPATRARLAEAGRLQARCFRWETSARDSVAFFERVLGRG
jgi:glycosyltransferase involved in cell wall biosynthesis